MRGHSCDRRGRVRAGCGRWWRGEGNWSRSSPAPGTPKASGICSIWAWTSEPCIRGGKACVDSYWTYRRTRSRSRRCSMPVRRSTAFSSLQGTQKWTSCSERMGRDLPRAEPGITAPLSRFLATADPGRSIALYRDVLGFQVQPAAQDYGIPGVVELLKGPARIQLVTQDAAPDSTGEQRPRGRAILFFESND